MIKEYRLNGHWQTIADDIVERVIENIDLSNVNLKIIGNYAFYKCTNLKKVVLPRNLESIGENSFKQCSSLSEIVYPGTISEWSSISLGTDWNSGIPATYIQCSNGQVTL